MLKIANFTLFLYMMKWRETKVVKIKISNLPVKLKCETFC